MTKLFKNSKHVLSFVLAFAVLAVSLFTGVVINSDAACDGTVSNWTGNDSSIELLDPTKENSEENPYIIENANQFAWLAITEDGKAHSANGAYYKVADGIKAFNLNRTGLDMSGDMTAAQVEAALGGDYAAGGSWYAGIFGGHFDGNGVEIYGLSTNNVKDGSGSLFGKAKAGATFKNFLVKNCYFKADSTGAIAQQSTGTGTISIENCVVTSVVTVSTRKNDATSYGGVLFGPMSCKLNIKNCLVYGNVAKHLGYFKDASIEKTGYEISYGLFGGAGNVDGSYTNVENSIILDCMPFSPRYSYADSGHVTFKNVYTNMIGVTVTNKEVNGEVSTTESNQQHSGLITQRDNGKFNLHTERVTNGATNGTIDSEKPADAFVAVTADSVKGVAGKALLSALDWDNIWFANAGMPELRALHNISDEATKTANGHTVKCEDCNLVSVELAHTYGADNKCTACGADKVCGTDKVLYWDGTRDDTLADNGEDGSANNPIIIDSAEELAKLVRTTAADSQGKHYKVSDEISAIILQPETVIDDAEAFMALADAAAVKKYFEDKIAAGVTPIDWQATNYFWSSIFDGHFDGNNVEIYGLYSNSDNAALFFQADGGGDTAIDLATPQSIIEGGTTFKNFAVKNAYLITSNRGGVVGQAYGAKAGITTGANINGVITFDSCVVANCYMRQTSAGKLGYTGILSGDVGTDLVNINNCLVYGNDAWNEGDNCAIALRANGRRDAVDGETKVYNKMTNTIALGVAPYNLNNYQADTHTGALCFENVYTDQPAGAVEMKNTWNTTTTVTFTEEQIKQLTGTTGAEIVAEIGNGLDLANTWIIGNDGTPALRSYHLGFKVTDNGDGTHSENCSCGVKGAAVAHTFDKAAADGKCTICGGDCAHAEENIAWISNNNATCLTPDTGHYECTACGLQDVEMDNPDFVAGHKFKDVEATPADCQGAGTIAHKLCEVCGNAFATTAADDEPMENALESTVDPIKDHTAKTDSNGDIIYDMSEAGYHAKTCSVCNTTFDKEAHIGDYTYDATGHAGQCTVCKMATSGKENHTFVDGACSTCPYVCPHNAEGIIWVSNNDGDCLTADTGHYKCTACGLDYVTQENPDFVPGHNFTTVNAEAADCTKTGTIAHKHCDKCNKNYATDASNTAAFSTALASVVDPIKDHTPVKDGNGDIVYNMDASGHSKTCAVCNNSFDAEGHDGDYVYDAEGHNGSCKVCKMATTGKTPHIFVDGACTTCPYVCPHSSENVIWVSNYDGDCFTADTGHYQCTACQLNDTEQVNPDFVAKSHTFNDVEAEEGSCSWGGNKAYKVCVNEGCNKYFAADETDVNSKNYIEWSEIETPIVPDNHNWNVVAEIPADCENTGTIAYKYCDYCDLFVTGEGENAKEIKLTIDYDTLNKETEDELEAAWDKAYNEFVAANGEPDNQEEFEALNKIMNDVYDEIWTPVYKAAIVAAAKAEGVAFEIAALGHNIAKVNEVAATYDKEGRKAHYDCDRCSKVFSDAEGKNVVEEKDLVIAKLVKAEGGDTNTESPKTGENVAAVAAVAALMGAAFVLVRKARKA